MSALVIAVNSQLGDKHFRDSLRQMHNEGYPLVKMIEDLGLDDDMSPAVREILDNLAPDVIDGIRRATLEMLDRDERMLPVSSDVGEGELDRGVAADIDVVETAHGRTIRVRRVDHTGPR